MAKLRLSLKELVIIRGALADELVRSVNSSDQYKAQVKSTLHTIEDSIAILAPK
jgi:hypothetical protein